MALGSEAATRVSRRFFCSIAAAHSFARDDALTRISH